MGTSTAAWFDRVELFRGLPEEERGLLLGSIRRRSFEPGETLFQRGDRGDGLMVVVDGLVRLSLERANGRSLSLRLAGPGEVFGEIALIDGGGRSADATAISRTAVETLSHRDFRRLFASSRALQENTLALLCRRLRETTEQLEAAALLPLEARLARIFTLFCRQSGSARPDGRVAFELAVTQGDLAALAGGSRPKVNAVLMAWESQGLLSRQGRRIICHAAELAAIAEGPDEA